MEVTALSGGLQRNAPSVCREACRLLRTILTNIVENPTEEKYRRVRTSGTAFKSKVWTVAGGSEFLLSVGFRLEGDWIIFPATRPLDALKDGLTALYVEDRVATRKEEEAMLDRMEAEQKREGILEGCMPLGIEELEDGLREVLRRHVEAGIYIGELSLTRDILQRVISHPEEVKYRAVNTASGGFRARVGEPEVVGRFLGGVGFIREVRPKIGEGSSGETSEEVWLVCPMEVGVRSLQPLRLLLDNTLSDRSRVEFEDQRAAITAARGRRQQQALAEPTKPPTTEEGRQKWRKENEEHLTASQLVSEIAAMMELNTQMEGKESLVAHHRKEQRKLLDQFSRDQNFNALHKLKEEWEVKLEHTRRTTGRSLLDTVHRGRLSEENTEGDDQKDQRT